MEEHEAMQVVARMTNDLQAVDELLKELDSTVRTYETGLPIYDDGEMAKMRLVVIRWMVKILYAEKN